MQRIAVFVRNHAHYLESACARSEKDPSYPITFRSAVRWSRAKEALDEQKILQLYLAPIGSKGTVEYEATLKSILLELASGDPETEKFLALALPETTHEGLWGEDGGVVKTLYSLSHCRRLPVTFPISKLRKASDGQPISEKYGYSYVPVLALDDAPPVELHPEEVTEPGRYVEGAVRSITVNAYERNTAAREKCVAHYGLRCAVCGFNFGTTYGEMGAGFIHVHHLTPLASIKDGYEVDPIKDLRPVCPNCHTMLHRRNPPYSIDELAAAIKATLARLRSQSKDGSQLRRNTRSRS